MRLLLLFFFNVLQYDDAAGLAWGEDTTSKTKTKHRPLGFPWSVSLALQVGLSNGMWLEKPSGHFNKTQTHHGETYKVCGPSPVCWRVVGIINLSINQSIN